MADRESLERRTRELMDADYSLYWRDAWKLAEAELGKAPRPAPRTRRVLIGVAIVAIVIVMVILFFELLPLCELDTLGCEGD